MTENMKRKEYVKPDMAVAGMEPAHFICLSYTIKDSGNPEDDYENYILQPTVAGSGKWSETEEGGGTVWGDLD